MDAKLFRLPTNPNFYAGNASANAFDAEQQQKRSQLASPDSRFPGWAAPMSDGRLVTDYRNHCSFNFPTGTQFATKEWMTKNASDLIQLGRERMALQTGAMYGTDPSVVPPPAMIVKCQTNDCERVPTNYPGGIGLERADTDTPELFGTWTSQTLSAAPRPTVALTTRFEGGRNSPRG
jgi:hypothetical protein